MSHAVLYVCRACGLHFNPQVVPYTSDELGWRCWHCMDDDEMEGLR